MTEDPAPRFEQTGQKAAERVRAITGFRTLAFRVVGASAALALSGLAGLIFLNIVVFDGLAMALSLVGAAFGLAFPLIIIAVVGGGVARLVVSRLRQGERADADIEQTDVAARNARVCALAAELRSDPDLALALDELEAQRRATVAQIARRRRLFVPVGLAAGAAAAWWVLSLPPSPRNQHPWLAALIVIVIAVAGALLLAEMTRSADAYREAFKRRVIPRLLTRFGASDARPGVNSDRTSLLDAAALLPDISPGGCRVENTITGVYRGRPIRIEEYRLYGRDKQGRVMQTKFDCAGLLITTSAERAWPGRVIVTGPASGGERWPAHIALERVSLEDPAFETVYRTCSDDRNLACAVLTPRMRAAMLGVIDGGGFLPPMLSIDKSKVALFAPFLSVSDAFMQPEATQADALGQAALQMETLSPVFEILDMLFDRQDGRMRATPSGQPAP